RPAPAVPPELLWSGEMTAPGRRPLGTPLARCRRATVVCALMAMAYSLCVLAAWANWVFVQDLPLPRVNNPDDVGKGPALSRLIGEGANAMSWRAATGLLALGVGLQFYKLRPRSPLGRWWVRVAATGVGLWAACELAFHLVFRPQAPEPTGS